MQHDAGRVDHGRESRRDLRRQTDRVRQEFVVGRRVDAASARSAGLLDRPGQRALHDGASEMRDGPAAGFGAEQRVDRGEPASHVDGHDPESRALREGGLRWLPFGTPDRLGCLHLTARSGSVEGSRMRLDARRAGATWLAATLVLAIGGSAAFAQDSPSATPSPEPKTTFVVGTTGDLNSANVFRQFDTTEAFVGGPDVRRLAPPLAEGLHPGARARRRAGMSATIS